MAADYGDSVLNERDVERARQYLICQVRGHQPSGFVTASIPPQNVCQHCGTYYWFTQPQLKEGMGKPSEAALAAALNGRPIPEASDG